LENVVIRAAKGPNMRWKNCRDLIINGQPQAESNR
jgi:hypothetical protein